MATTTTNPSPSPSPTHTPHQLSVVVYGMPAPQGSKKHIGRGILVDTNKDALHSWREDVKLATLRVLAEHTSWEHDYPAIIGHFVFVLPRPKAHHVAGDADRELRANAPHLHTTRPDLDKLLRATWDALTTAGAYVDDNRVAQAYALKTYVGPDPNGMPVPGARIHLSGARA